ncbi:DNA-binding CsgD family transcriptional regulator [Streptacidiphilus sp. MAP12-20]|uniref:LuxR C-terminal-related transcriptional regulator n=1 Tax=Streptacidiphilus sp. MAP12-20 TaxID=3156299 RepID=UPI0035128D89
MSADLTERELAVLLAAASGMSQRETAAQLRIGRTKARRIAEAATRKLGAATLPHAVALAIREHLIDTGEIPGRNDLPTPHQPTGDNQP